MAVFPPSVVWWSVLYTQHIIHCLVCCCLGRTRPSHRGLLMLCPTLPLVQGLGHTRSWSLLPERRRGREEPRCTPGAAHSDPGPWQPTTPLQPCQSIRDLGLIFTTNFIVQLYVNVWTVKWLMSCKIPKCGHRSMKIWLLAARDISIIVTET